MVLALKETLSQVYNGNMDDSILHSFVVQLQDEFVQQMDRLTGNHVEDGNWEESDTGSDKKFTAENGNVSFTNKGDEGDSEHTIDSLKTPQMEGFSGS